MTIREVEALAESKAAESARKEKAKITRPLRMHAEGLFISELLKERYPTETQDVFNYRVKNLPRVTQDFFTKVSNVLSRIRQARDFSISGWNKSGYFGEFENYCLHEYPIGGSVVDWVFNEGIRSMLVEPNGVIVVGFQDWFTKTGDEIAETGYASNKPITKIFRSDHVRLYEADKVCWIYCKEQKIDLVIKLEEDPALPSYGRYSVSTAITRARVKEYLVLTVPEGLSTFPALVLGGEALSFHACEIYNSFVQTAVPSLDKIIQTKSEEDLMIKENVHSRLVMIGGPVCETCSGLKEIRDPKTDKYVKCGTCHGSGVHLTNNAAAVTIIQAPKTGQSLPFDPPGMYYVAPGMEPLNALVANIKAYWYSAYSSINFEFLTETPLAQSGVAKENDRQEMNSFLFKVGSHVINRILNPIINLFAEYLYENKAYDAYLRKNICPAISVPRNFEVPSVSQLENELTLLRNAQADKDLFVSIELEIIETRFANQPNEKQILRDILLMNPLGGLTEDAKNAQSANGSITKEDFYIANNIGATIRELYQDDPEFGYLSFSMRKEIAYNQIAAKFPTEVSQSVISDAVENDFTSAFDFTGILSALQKDAQRSQDNQNNSDIAAGIDLEDVVG